MIEYGTVALLVVFLAGMLSMLVLGPWYFISLRKLIGVAKQVDPQVWMEWGSPQSLYDLNFMQNRRLIRSIAKQAGVSSALAAHPTFRLTRRLYFLTTRIVVVITALVVASAIISRTA